MFGEEQDIDDLDKEFAEAQKNDSPIYGGKNKDADAPAEKTDPFEISGYDSQSEDLKREMAEDEESDDEEDEEESDEEKSPKSEEDEEEESDDADDDEEEEDDEESDEDPKRKGKPQFISQKQYYAQQRKTNKALENITSALEKLSAGDLTPKEEDKSVEEIQRLAKEAGISEEKLPAFIEALQKQILAPMEPIIAEVEQQKFEAAESKNDEKEWNEVVPNIQTAWPNATPAQLQKARALMHELAHSTKYGFVDANHPPMPLDYILFKEQAKFKELFKAKKKTFESGSRGASERTDDEPKGRAYERKSPENYTPKDIEQMEADFNSQVDESDTLTINRDGRKIRVKQ